MLLWHCYSATARDLWFPQLLLTCYSAKWMWLVTSGVIVLLIKIPTERRESQNYQKPNHIGLKNESTRRYSIKVFHYYGGFILLLKCQIWNCTLIPSDRSKWKKQVISNISFCWKVLGPFLHSQYLFYGVTMLLSVTSTTTIGDLSIHCFGSGLVDFRSGSSILGWIPIRWKKCTAENCFWYLFDQKLQFSFPRPP